MSTSDTLRHEAVPVPATAELGGSVVEDDSIDERSMTRHVLGDLAGVWAGIWQQAADMQTENDGVRRLAEAKTDDPEQAIVELMPQLMLLHPRIVASVLAFCRAVETEFSLDADGIAVVGPYYNPDVETERDEEASDAPHRLAQMEHDDAENRLRDLEAENARLRAALADTDTLYQRAVQRLQAIRVVAGNDDS